MTIEQLILLILLVGIPVGRKLMQWMDSQRAKLAGDRSPAPPPAEEDDETEPSWSWQSAPAVPPVPRPAAQAHEPQHRRRLASAAPSTVASRRSVALPATVSRPAGNDATRAARALIRGGRHDLRQGVALMAILGPPRAQEPPG